MSYPRNMADRVGDWLDNNDEGFLIIDPSWSDEFVLREWVESLGLDPFPPGTQVIRHTFYRYSARQVRQQQPEYDDYWGDDGELKTWVEVAEIGRRPWGPDHPDYDEMGQ